MIAGAVASYFVWRHKTPVNMQIMLYLLGRIIYGGAKKLSKDGYLPKWKAFSVTSIAFWGFVMAIYYWDPDVLQSSLSKSMDYLYLDSDVVGPSV